MPQGRLAVAVVLGASGSVITDALGPYEVFARSPEFLVYTVSAGPAAVLSGGLVVVPDYLLSDVDAGMAPEPAVVVVPAMVFPVGRKGRPLREWLARRAGRGAARVLVPEHQQLGILGRLAPGQHHQAAEHTAHGQVEDRKGHSAMIPTRQAVQARPSNRAPQGDGLHADPRHRLVSPVPAGPLRSAMRDVPPLA